MIRVVLLSRTGQWALIAAAGMWLAAIAIGRAALEVDLSPTFPPTKVVVVEMCVVVAATLLGIVTRPRFWEWDRVARGHRAKVLAGVVAATVIGCAVLCVPALVPWLPDGTPWGWVFANALVLAAFVVLLTPFLSALVAGGVTLALWFAAAVVANLAPAVWLPLAYYRGHDPSWAVAAALVVAAVAVHVRTCGMTAWAHRQFER
jgi:hypothetical protein